MARKRPRRWEDEEEEEEDEDLEEEEEEEEYDEDDELPLEQLFENSVRALIKERKKYDPRSPEYYALSQRIADETETLKNAQLANNESVQARNTERHKHDQLFGILGNVAGTVAGTTIASLINRQNVKSVVQAEQDGAIIGSKATTFLTKPRG